MSDRKLVLLSRDLNADTGEVFFLVSRQDLGCNKRFKHSRYRKQTRAQYTDFEAVLEIGYKGPLTIGCILLKSPSQPQS